MFSVGNILIDLFSADYERAKMDFSVKGYKSEMPSIVYNTVMAAYAEKLYWINTIEKESGWFFDRVDLRYRYLGTIDKFCLRKEFFYDRENNKIDYKYESILLSDHFSLEGHSDDGKRFVDKYRKELERIIYLQGVIDSSIKQASSLKKDSLEDDLIFGFDSDISIPSYDYNKEIEKRLNLRANDFIKRYSIKGIEYLVDVLNQLAVIPDISDKITKYSEIRDQITDSSFEEEVLFWISLYVKDGDEIYKEFSNSLVEYPIKRNR